MRQVVLSVHFGHRCYGLRSGGVDHGVDLDDNTWRRARGWSAWKAAITLADPASPPLRQQESRHALRAVLHDSTTDR